MNLIKTNIKPDFYWILLLSCIVLFPNFYLAAVSSDLNGSFFWKISYLLISFVIFFTPSLFLKARYFFLLHGIFVLLAPIEIVHIYLNKMGIMTGFMIAVFDTNKNEVLEIFTSMLPIILVFLFIWVVYFFILFKKIKNRYIISDTKLRIAILAVFLFIFMSFFAYMYRIAYILTPKEEQHRVPNVALSFFTLKFEKIYPCSIILKSIYAIDINVNVKKNREELNKFSFNAEKQSIKEREIYVFVIGEAARYKNFSINGYERETSPLLSKTDGLVSYSNFYSGANFTNISLPLILTRATATDYYRWTKEKSFVDAFKEAGFKTYWIANQGAGNKFIRRISKDADEEFFETKNLEATNTYDQKLWIYLDKILNRNEEKVLIVIHSLGSHFRYNFRYPPNFEVFKPGFKDRSNYNNYNLVVPENKQLFVNTYDNSILYTDYFLANTIKKIENQNTVAFFAYTSDHGENLFDTDENLVLHGSSEPTEFEIHVPLFIWSSKKYQEIYSEKWKNILANKDKKTSAKILFYSMLDAADITFPEQDLEQCFTSDFMKEDSVRYVLTPDMSVKSFK